MLHDGVPFDRQTALELTGRRGYRLVGSGVAREVLRGIYVDAAAPDTFELRCAALALVLPPDAVLCRGTVAWQLGVGDVRLPGQVGAALVECVLPTGRTPVRRPGLRCYSAPLGSADVIEAQGLLRTSDLRTAIDLARWCPRPMALAALDAMSALGRLDVDVARYELTRFAGHRGAGQARELLDLVEPLTESFGESWLRLRLHDAGFPRPSAQIPVADADGVLVYRLDLGFERQRVGTEYDGDEYHGSSALQTSDSARRDRLRREFGWEVVGFHRGHVWGGALHLERAVGELLGLDPQIVRRRW